MTRLATLAVVATLASNSAVAQLPSSAPDAIYHNARIITVNDRFDVVQALAVKDGRIQALGSDESIRRLAGPTTKVVDLRGRTVLPGFYDNHIHLGEELQPWKGGMVGAVPEWLRDANDIEALL